MEKNITKKCKACELNFEILDRKNKRKKTDYEFPKNIPISKEMRDAVNAVRNRDK